MKTVPQQAAPLDAGLLPAWGVADLPAPPAFTARNVFKTIGPGVIGLGVAIGSGEWLLGPSVVVTYGAALLWIATVAVGLQILLNLEMARYTLYTGEPIITGYMRTWPGPGVWGWTYAVLGFLQYGWPGWALASATASAALLLGRMPTEADAGTVVRLGYATFGACFLIALLGKKVERTIEYAMWIMVSAVVLYLLAVDVATVSGAHWASVFGGFSRVGVIPAGADWFLLGAFAAYSGLGGIGNAYVTNWMRDKGFGMGATVGYIPGAAGGNVRLAAHGNVFTVNAASLRAWRGWWKFVNVDQWAIFGFGSLAAMALTALFTLQYVPAGSRISGWAVANLQASGIAAVHGPLFWHLTLICGFWVLFSTQLGVVDGLPRATTDVLWSGSAAVRRWRGGDVRAVYYGVLAVFAVWGCVALNLAQPITLIIIGANIAGFNFVLEGVHTIVVNRRFLPRELRPARWREAALVLMAIFYGLFVALALWRLAQS
jgi:hypothetical protein